MKLWSRFGVAASLVLLFVLLPSHVDPSAFAETILPPSAPPPLNGLPSTVVGSTSVTGASRLEYQMSLLYRWSKKPAFWQAVNDVQMGVGTSAQTSQVAAEAAAYRVPATRVASPVKVVGGVLTAVSGFQFGTMIGNAATTLIGIDVDGLVCAQGDAAEFLGLLTGANCSGVVISSDYPANSDAVLTSTGARVCNSSVPDRCATLVGEGGLTASGSPSYCFVVEGGSVSGLLARGQDPVTLALSGAVGGGSTPLSGSNIQRCSSYPVANAIYSSGSSLPVGWVLYDYGWGTSGGYNVGNSTAVVAGESDPSRSLRCVVLGADGIEYSASTLTYTEGSGVLPDPVCPDLPAGVLADTVTIFEDSPLGSTQLWSESTTPEFDAASQLAPECSSGTCMLDLRSSTGSCFQTPTECADWFADPNRETNYSCHYGTHVVALTECYVYAPTFAPEASVTGDYYGDPTTGEAVGAPAGAAPGSDGSTFGQSVQDPSQGRECFPTGWAVLNPVEWVMKPVQCALQWAFVPRASVINSAGVTIKDGVNSSLFGSVGALTVAFAAPFEIASSGCLGPPFRLQLTGDLFPGGGMDETYYPLAACDPPMSNIALFFNALTQGFITFAAGMASIRYFAGIFGYSGFGRLVNPVVGGGESSGVTFK